MDTYLRFINRIFKIHSPFSKTFQIAIHRPEKYVGMFHSTCFLLIVTTIVYYIHTLVLLDKVILAV